MIGTDKAPSSVRDQIFDHQSNVVRYYLDWEIRFNTQVAFLDRSSDQRRITCYRYYLSLYNFYEDYPAGKRISGGV